MITMECHANFVNEKPIVSIQTELYNRESGKFLTGSDSEEQNIFRINTKDSHDISLFIDRKRDLSLLSVAHFFYTEEDEYGDPYLASATEVRDEVKILADDLVEEFQVLDPIIGKRKPTQREYVQVVYNREATVKEDYDYNSLKSIRDNKLPIELPVGARVKVNQFHQIDGFYEDFGAHLYLEDLSEGTTEYYGEPGILQVDERTLQWDYAADWKRILDISGCKVKTTVRIYCRVCLKITDNKGSNPRPVWFTFQSVPLEEQGHVGEPGDITINDHPLIIFRDR